MLDTKARKYMQPVFDKLADNLIKLRVSANQTTAAAFIIGLLAALMVFFNYSVTGVVLLWISGLLDAIDGTIARKTQSSSAIGTLLDILFDRIVEILVILAITFTNPSIGIYTALVFASIILSITVFLTVGALSERKSNKSFYYQAGLAERTEGFIMISLVVLVSDFRSEILIVFAAMILFTAFQRVAEAIKILK